MMVAWLERDVEGCAARAIARLRDRSHFRVRAAVLRMPAFADYRTIPHEHCADLRIRLDPAPPARGKLQRTTHVKLSAQIGDGTVGFVHER